MSERPYHIYPDDENQRYSDLYTVRHRTYPDHPPSVGDN